MLKSAAGQIFWGVIARYGLPFLLFAPSVVGIFVWSLFQFRQATNLYILTLGLLELYLLITSERGKKYIDKSKWSDKEVVLLQRYNLYFRYPFTSKSLSKALSLIQLMSFVWIPWLLYNRLWIQAIIMGLSYIEAGARAAELNPRFYLHDAVEKRHMLKYLQDMLTVDSICEKLSKSTSEDVLEPNKL